MRKLLVIFLFLVCCACGPEKKERVLTEPELSALLTDIYIAEARLEILHLPKDSTIRFFIPFEEKLLQARGIPDSVLKSTYAYYLSHPKELEQVYDTVIDTLTIREKRLSHGPVPAKKTEPLP